MTCLFSDYTSVIWDTLTWLWSTSEAQADPELLQRQASVSVPVAVLSELLSTPSWLQPPSQKLTKRSGLAFTQHPTGVNVQLTEVPPQYHLWPGGLCSLWSSWRDSVQDRRGGGRSVDRCRWRAGGRCVWGSGGKKQNQEIKVTPVKGAVHWKSDTSITYCIWMQKTFEHGHGYFYPTMENYRLTLMIRESQQNN